MTISRIEQLLEFISEDPNDSFSMYALALEYHKAGDLQQAILQLEKLRFNNPDYLALYYQLGNFYIQQNDFKNAEMVLNDGILLANAQKNKHTLAELKQSLSDIVDDDF